MARKRGWGQSRHRRPAQRPAPGAILSCRVTWDALHRTHSGHVHGRLRITLGDRDVPSMGFFGPEDVCFHAWAQELRRALTALGAQGQHVYDEGEEGQPAFEFVRSQDDVLISLIDSRHSDGLADERWQKVRCTWPQFSEQIKGFLRWYDQQEAQGWPALPGG